MTAKKPQPSQTDKVKEFARAKLQSFEPKDNKDSVNLTNEIMRELKIPKGSYQKVKKTVLKVMQETGKTIPNLTSKGGMGIVNVNLKKDETLLELPTATQPAQAPTQISQGAMPKGFKPQGILPTTTTAQQTQIQQTGQQQIFIMTDDQKQRQQRTFEKIFDKAGDIYVKLGIIEGEGKQEPKPTLQQFKADLKDLAGETNDYLIDSKTKLPEWIDLALLIISFVIVLGTPVLNTIFFGTDNKKKAESDSSLESVGEENAKH